MSTIQIIASVLYVVLTSIFWRMGGAAFDSFPFKYLPNNIALALTDKRWRRYGAPALTLAFGLIMMKWWQGPLAALVMWTGAILPITLIGGSRLGNWWWHPIHGLVYGGASLAITLLAGWLFGLIAAGVVAILYATYIIGFTLLDRKSTFDWWAIQELFTGATFAGAITLLAWVT
jgi:hypothetical protein